MNSSRFTVMITHTTANNWQASICFLGEIGPNTIKPADEKPLVRNFYSASGACQWIKEMIHSKAVWLHPLTTSYAESIEGANES